MKRAPGLLILLCSLVALFPLVVASADAAEVPARYSNPLQPTLADGRVVQSCPDPSVLRGRGSHARTWFMYCTSNRPSPPDRAAAGASSTLGGLASAQAAGASST